MWVDKKNRTRDTVNNTVIMNFILINSFFTNFFAKKFIDSSTIQFNQYELLNKLF